MSGPSWFYTVSGESHGIKLCVWESCLSYSDASDVGVPFMHLLHSDEQDVMKFLQRCIQLCLQSENLPVSSENLTIDYVSIRLKGKDVHHLLLH